MKSELVMQDFGGKLGSDMDGTRARLIQGGSWKRQRVILILPADYVIPAKVALAHWNLIFPPNNGVVRLLALGMEVGDAYSTAIQNILAHPDLKDWEYLLTIEHDNMPPQDGLLKLLEIMESRPDLSCVSGLYFCKGEGGCAQIWGDPKDPVLNFRPQLPVPEALVECCGVGQGFALFRLSMFKDERLRKPWFKTLASKEGVGTQDLYFWSDARKYGYRCAVNCSVKVGHYDMTTGTIW